MWTRPSNPGFSRVNAAVQEFGRDAGERCGITGGEELSSACAAPGKESGAGKECAGVACDCTPGIHGAHSADAADRGFQERVVGAAEHHDIGTRAPQGSKVYLKESSRIGVVNAAPLHKFFQAGATHADDPGAI